MNLDRFTQKAQEAIAAAQELATRLKSPVLDAEHLLAAPEPEEVGAQVVGGLVAGVRVLGERGELIEAEHVVEEGANACFYTGARDQPIDGF